MDDLADKSERLKNKNLTNNDYEVLIKRINDEKNQLSSENERLKKEIKELRGNNIIELEEKNKNLLSEIDALKASIESLNTKIELLIKDNEKFKLNNAIDQEEAKKLRLEMDKLNDEKNKLFIVSFIF